MRILITGGAGYIGSVATELLLQNGYQVTVLDDLSTGHIDAVSDSATLVKGSILDKDAVKTALRDCEAVIHFAGKSLVSESVEKPDLYRNINIGGTKILLNEMQAMQIQKIVFSSSAATYGEPKSIPILETSITKPTNPYGASKLTIDLMLANLSYSSNLAAISLRYFNVAGSLETSNSRLSERHLIETHLIPNILKSTSDNPIKIYGTDWPTPDGTCIRDYVHVIDLVEAHITALNKLQVGAHQVINLGSGRGYSVREVISTVEEITFRNISSTPTSRRAGDPAVLVADISKAKKILGWEPKRTLQDMVSDTNIAFQANHLTK
jgi:UDP-glucose 4-epimerase